MAPLVRTGGSRHTGLAALPHRNIQIVRKFCGFSKPKHIYVCIPEKKDLEAEELQKSSAANETVNRAETEPSAGHKCGLLTNRNMAPSNKANEKEECNSNYEVRQKMKDKRIKFNSMNYECEEGESL